MVVVPSLCDHPAEGKCSEARIAQTVVQMLGSTKDSGQMNECSVCSATINSGVDSGIRGTGLYNLISDIIPRFARGMVVPSKGGSTNHIARLHIFC